VHSGVPSTEQPRERFHIESGHENRDSTATVDAHNLEPSGAPIVNSAPVVESLTQDKHDVSREAQPESLNTTNQEDTDVVGTPIGPYCTITVSWILLMIFTILESPPTAIPDSMTDDPNLGGFTETVDKPKTEEAVSEQPAESSVERVEKSSIEPPKGVEVYDQDNVPEEAAGDSKAAQEPPIEDVQKHTNDKVGSITPSQVAEQEIPTGMCSFPNTDLRWGLLLIQGSQMNRPTRPSVPMRTLFPLRKIAPPSPLSISLKDPSKVLTKTKRQKQKQIDIAMLLQRNPQRKRLRKGSSKREK
jgi:hypothetical protein